MAHDTAAAAAAVVCCQGVVLRQQQLLLLFVRPELEPLLLLCRVRREYTLLGGHCKTEQQCSRGAVGAHVLDSPLADSAPNANAHALLAIRVACWMCSMTTCSGDLVARRCSTTMWFCSGIRSSTSNARHWMVPSAEEDSIAALLLVGKCCCPLPSAITRPAKAADL